MPLQEIHLNTIAISCLPPSQDLHKRKRGENNPEKQKDIQKLSNDLRIAVVTLRMLENQSYKEIYKNIKISTFTACTIIQNAKKSA